MKANRKFIEANEHAVSAVIGVILMVAITVAIAATVYVYVSGMIGGQRQQAPTLQFTVDESLDRLVVATTSPSVPWTGISLRCDKAVAAYVNADVANTATNLTVDLLTAITVGSQGTGLISAAASVAASDFIDVEASSSTVGINNAKITIVHQDTGTTLGTYTIITVATRA